MRRTSSQINKNDSEARVIKKIALAEINKLGVKPSSSQFVRSTNFTSGATNGANFGNPSSSLGMLQASGGQNSVFSAAGQVAFGGSTGQVSSSFSLFYDATNSYLGINTDAPEGALNVCRLVLPPGTIDSTSGSPAIVGTGTTFTSTFKPGDSISFEGSTYTVLSITTDTDLTLTTNASVNSTEVGYSTTEASILNVLPNGNISVGGVTPTARVHLPAGTASVNTAPFKFTSGTNLTTPESGVMEYDGTRFYLTNSTPTRYSIPYFSSAGFTTGSVLFAGSTTEISQDNSNLFWDDTNNTLGIGTTRTGAISGTNPNLRVKGTGATSATSAFEVQNSAATSLLLVRDDGLINFGTKGSYTESSGQFALSTSGSGAGLLVGGDVQWYRNAANVWRTPDAVIVDGAITASSTLTITGGQLLSTFATFPQIYINSAQHAAIYLNRLNAASYTTQFRFLTGAAEKWRFGSTASNEDLYYTYFNGSSWIDAFRLIHNTGQVYFPVTGSGAGIVIGGDTQIYRSAADILRTPDQLLIDRAVSSGVVTLSDGATPALNAALGNTFVLTAAGDRTIAVPTNPTTGQVIIIVHTASGGARTLALNTGAGGFAFGTTITALTATSSGLTDYITCIYDATSSKWRIIGYEKGF